MYTIIQEHEVEGCLTYDQSLIIRVRNGLLHCVPRVLSLMRIANIEQVKSIVELLNESNSASELRSLLARECVGNGLTQHLK